MLEVLLGTGSAAAVVSRISPAAVTLHAPHLGAEVAQVLRRYVLSGADRAWQLRQNVTVYDALYVALAEALQAPLLTTDARPARSPGHRAAIEVVIPAGAERPSTS